MSPRRSISYANGVIDEHLPGTDIRLEPDWALQDPNDYLEVFKHAVPSVLLPLLT